MNLSNMLSNTSGGGGSRLSTIVWLIAGALTVVFGGILISTLTPLILPPAASAEGQQIDELFRFMLAIGGAIFLLVQVVLVISVIGFRAKPGDTSDGPPIRGNTTLEFVWTIIPAIIVLVLTLYSWNVWNAIGAPKENEQTIGVTGARFAWTFNYAIDAEGLPPDFDLATLDSEVLASLENGELNFNAPQLHTWVNQPVRLEMTTQDVNHAFWIPAMRIKQDLLAGRTTEYRFTPIEAGVFRIVCAELCGTGHGAMAGGIDPITGDLLGAWLVVWESEEQFLEQFFAPERQVALFPPEDPVLRGRQILASGQYPCQACHVLDDLGWAGNDGPALNGIGGEARISTRLSATGLPNMTAYLDQSFRHPEAYLVPGFGNLMNQFNPEPDQPNYMPQEDLDAIIAYLLSQTGG
ncbi:MAG: cytochrome c oxidase subunit II [Chloroflexi bacterium]|nr:cytochrome c oxidase subunit II [Chloroflexota bacterium]